MEISGKRANIAVIGLAMPVCLWPQSLPIAAFVFWAWISMRSAADS